MATMWHQHLLFFFSWYFLSGLFVGLWATCSLPPLYVTSVFPFHIPSCWSLPVASPIVLLGDLHCSHLVSRGSRVKYANGYTWIVAVSTSSSFYFCSSNCFAPLGLAYMFSFLLLLLFSFFFVKLGPFESREACNTFSDISLIVASEMTGI